VNTPRLIRLLLRWHARYFVRVLYLALLERDADDDGLAAHSAELGRTSDLIGTARAIARSEEGWSKSLYSRPAPIVTAAFRGVLDRDPEAEALAAYCESLVGHRNLAALIDDLGRSEEHWQRLRAVHAEALVRAAFLSLLKREPDPEALAAYSAQLRETADLAAVMSAIAESVEHRELLSQQHQDPGQSLRADDLPTLLAEVVKSPKVWGELAAMRFPQPAFAFEACEQDAWVFIHAKKTGGTSLQHMLADTFGDRQVYREHGDTLYRRSPAELAQYTVFAGHFDYASVAFIPRRTRHLFTFLREPRQRLLSQYRFLRAHEPGSPDFKGEMKIANRLEPEQFFRSVVAHTESALWNHLTWCVMGQHKWNAYRHLLSGEDPAALATRLKDIRVEIRARLREFAFIGLQEDYQHSCQRLFELMGAHMPRVRHDHSVELLSANLQYFKYVARRPLTAEVEKALTPLVQLDDIVYQEGSDLYTHRSGRIADVGGFRLL
jgi:hypothetical protein